MRIAPKLTKGGRRRCSGPGCRRLSGSLATDFCGPECKRNYERERLRAWRARRDKPAETERPCAECGSPLAPGELLRVLLCSPECVRRRAARLKAARVEKEREENGHPLFTGSAEAVNRRRAVLDALDLLDLADNDGWVSFLNWAERKGYNPGERNRPSRAGRTYVGSGPKDAGHRQWERVKARLREHGIDVVPRPPDEYANTEAGRKDRNVAFSTTALRFTEEGLDRLRALTKALDDWLCSVQEEIR